MLIEFDIRAFDCRIFEFWQAGKYLAAWPNFRRAMWIAFLSGFVIWYRYPNTFGLSGDVNFFLLPFGLQFSVIATAFLFRFVQAWRFRGATDLVEGHHSLHFSPAGVHHVSPDGVHRYPWTSFAGLDVSAHYLFMRFSAPGSLIIPVAALARFGPAYDEAFLQELAPLVQQGMQAQE